MKYGLNKIAVTGARWIMLASSILAIVSFASAALSEDVAPLVDEPGRRGSRSRPQFAVSSGREQSGRLRRSVVGFNEPMFTFNLKLDDWVLRPECGELLISAENH